MTLKSIKNPFIIIRNYRISYRHNNNVKSAIGKPVFSLNIFHLTYTYLYYTYYSR